MKSKPTPPTLGRKAEDIAQALLDRLSLYQADWTPSKQGPTQALIRIFSRYLQSLGERIDAAAQKRGLAFLDMLGLDLLPAQPARAPVVFKALPPQIGDSVIPKGTRVGAKNTNTGETLVFETENEIALACASLVNVIAVDPYNDKWADQSGNLANPETKKPFTPFKPSDNLVPIEHSFYIGQDPYFSISGNVVVELSISVLTPGGSYSYIAWKYYSGNDWIDFNPSLDETVGFESVCKKHLVTIKADDAQSFTCSNNDIKTYWIKGNYRCPISICPYALRPLVPVISIDGVRSYSRELAAVLSITEKSDPDTRTWFGSQICLTVKIDSIYSDFDTSLTMQVVITGPTGKLAISGPVNINTPPLTTKSPIDPGQYHMTASALGFNTLQYDFLLDISSPNINQSTATITIMKNRAQLLPEPSLFFGQVRLDINGIIQPFGQQAQVGCPSFDIGCAADFGQKNSKIIFNANDTDPSQKPQKNLGGKIWSKLDAGISDKLLSISFMDSMNGMAICSSGVSPPAIIPISVYITKDGGNSWFPCLLHDDNLLRPEDPHKQADDLRSVYLFPDMKRAVAVGTNSTILVTNDGGEHWTRSNSDIIDMDPANEGSQVSLSSVHFSNRGYGMTVGSRGWWLRPDSGATWGAYWAGVFKYAQPHAGNKMLTSVYCFDDSRSVAVGFSGTVMIGTLDDQSETKWNPAYIGSAEIPYNLTQNLVCVHFADAMHGWAVGENGVIIVTYNRGDSWLLQISGTTNTLNAVYCADPQNIVAVGDNGTILVTQDAGHTWSPWPGGSNTTNNLRSVYYDLKDGTHGVAVGDNGTVLILGDAEDPSSKKSLSKTLTIEYRDRNRKRWTDTGIPSNVIEHFIDKGGNLTFDLNFDILTDLYHDLEATWFRMRITSGGFGYSCEVSGKEVIDYAPPLLDGFSVQYFRKISLASPQICMTYDDYYGWEDVTLNNSSTGFTPFKFVPDSSQTVYLGFDRSLPAGEVSFYFDLDISESAAISCGVVWECWDGKNWQELITQDDTYGFSTPGIVTLLWPGASLPLLERFGNLRCWIRIHGQAQDAIFPNVTIKGIYLNAVWADQVQTFQNEILGTGDGQLSQIVFFPRKPILAGERIEVRELDGARAEAAWPMLEAELRAKGLSDEDFRLVKDRRTDRLSEVWVRWQSKPNLFFSGPDDRHYVIERSQGRVLFGDGRHGLPPPPGTTNILAWSYRSGGGTVGNVPAGAINQLLSGVLSSGVDNPRAAEGGTDTETLEAAARRCPAMIRHRRQAITLADYEDLAREASPAVALARAVFYPAHQSAGGMGDGFIPAEPARLQIWVAPISVDPQPLPSLGLCQEILQFVKMRVPATAAGLIQVAPPIYQPIAVQADIAPVDFNEAKTVLDRCQTALAAFLHPLTGGPEGQGWAFGRDVFLSDVAAVLGAVPGVGYLAQLSFLDASGNPVADLSISVPEDRLVAVGSLKLKLASKGG